MINTMPGRVLVNKYINQNGCWVWKGYCVKEGYGQVQIKGKVYYVHRLSGCVALKLNYEDNSFDILHKCDNPPCFNPDHLFKGDPGINARDSAAKGRRNGFRLLWRKKINDS